MYVRPGVEVRSRYWSVELINTINTVMLLRAQAIGIDPDRIKSVEEKSS